MNSIYKCERMQTANWSVLYSGHPELKFVMGFRKKMNIYRSNVQKTFIEQIKLLQLTQKLWHTVYGALIIVKYFAVACYSWRYFWNH